MWQSFSMGVKSYIRIVWEINISHLNLDGGNTKDERVTKSQRSVVKFRNAFCVVNKQRYLILYY